MLFGKNRLSLWLFLTALLGTMAGCQSIKVVPNEGKLANEYIEKRASDRWDALIKGRFDLVYSYETPSFREIYTDQDVRGKYGSFVRWSDAKITDVKVNSDVADVTVYIKYISIDGYGGSIEGERPIKERWVYIDNDWWFLRK